MYMGKQCAKYTKQEQNTKHQNMACEESRSLNTARARHSPSSSLPKLRPFNEALSSDGGALLQAKGERVQVAVKRAVWMDVVVVGTGGAGGAQGSPSCCERSGLLRRLSAGLITC